MRGEVRRSALRDETRIGVMLCCASGGEFLLMRAVCDCCSFTGKSTLLGEKRMEIHKHTQVRTGALILKFTVDCLPAWLVGSY